MRTTPSTRSRGSREFPCEINEDLEGRRRVSSAGIVKAERGQRRSPGVENAHEPPRLDVLAHVRFHEEPDADTVEHGHAGEAGLVQRDLPVDIDLHRLALGFKLPAKERTVRQACPNAGMRQKVGRYLGQLPALEIGRRRDHRVTPCRPERNGDHVAGHEVPAAHAEIETVRHNVHEVALGHEVDLHAREPPQVFEDERRQDLPARRGEGVDAQSARGRLLLRPDRVERAVNVFERRADLIDEALPGAGQRHAAGRAVEEPHAQMLFELRDRAAERARGHPHVQRGSPERSPAGNRQDRVEIGQLVDRHHPESQNSTS